MIEIALISIVLLGFMRNGRGLGVINWETDRIFILQSSKEEITREERKKIMRGDYIAKEEG